MDFITDGALFHLVVVVGLDKFTMSNFVIFIHEIAGNDYISIFLLSYSYYS